MQIKDTKLFVSNTHPAEWLRNRKTVSMSQDVEQLECSSIYSRECGLEQQPWDTIWQYLLEHTINILGSSKSSFEGTDTCFLKICIRIFIITRNWKQLNIYQ